MHGMVGILGGMGPLATSDFMRKLTEATPAKIDQEDIPVAVYSVPQIADRSTSILNHNDDPLAAMQIGVDALEKMGAQCIVIPCNTAHFWFDRLNKAEDTTILHIADMVVESLQEKNLKNCKIGILATLGTISAGIYQKRLSPLGYQCVIPNAEDQDTLVRTGILAIKGGQLNVGKALLELAVSKLSNSGCEAIIMGCTEIPIVLKSMRKNNIELLDATQELANGAVRWYLQKQNICV